MALTTQPLPVFNFRVFFSPSAQETNAFDSGDAAAAAVGLARSTVVAPKVIGFAEVSGINSELEIEEYREGGRNIGPRRFPKWGRFPNLVFRRGITDDTFLWEWWADVITHSYTLTLGSTLGSPRRNGVIILENNAHKAMAGWFFTNALPDRLVGPGLSARGNEIAIETLELSHEGLFRLPITNLPA
jgi:phage tail-like protein